MDAEPPLGSVAGGGAAVGDACGSAEAGDGVVVCSSSEREGDNSTLLIVETSDVRAGCIPVELMVALWLGRGKEI